MTKILSFPRQKKTKTARTVKNIDGIKYFTKSQINLMRRTVKDQSTTGRLSGVRDWLLLDLLTGTGLRVAEAANVRCGDLRDGYGESAIFVRKGKGAKSRTVQIPVGLKKHLRSFLSWKRNRGEPTGQDDHLFVGQRGPWTVAAIQQVVKKHLKALGLYEPGKSCHSLRHSYATELYRSARDLRAVQKQLGHSSFQTTQIYADVTVDDIQEQVNEIWRK